MHRGRPRWLSCRPDGGGTRHIGSDEVEIREVALAEQGEFALCTAAVEPQFEERERSGHLILLG